MLIVNYNLKKIYNLIYGFVFHKFKQTINWIIFTHAKEWELDKYSQNLALGCTFQGKKENIKILKFYYLFKA